MFSSFGRGGGGGGLVFRVWEFVSLDSWHSGVVQTRCMRVQCWIMRRLALVPFLEDWLFF